MAVPTQTGTDYVIGFKDLSYTGFLVADTLERTTSAVVDEVRDVDNNTSTVLIADDAKRISCDFYIVNAGSFAPPAIGTTITLTPPEGAPAINFMCEASSVKTTRKYAVLSLTLVKETSMTYA